MTKRIDAGRNHRTRARHRPSAHLLPVFREGREDYASVAYYVEYRTWRGRNARVKKGSWRNVLIDLFL